MSEETSQVLLNVSPEVFKIYETILKIDPFFKPINSFQICDHAKTLGIRIYKDSMGCVKTHEIPSLGRPPLSEKKLKKTKNGRYIRPFHKKQTFTGVLEWKKLH